MGMRVLQCGDSLQLLLHLVCLRLIASEYFFEGEFQSDVDQIEIASKYFAHVFTKGGSYIKTKCKRNQHSIEKNIQIQPFFEA